MKEISYQDAAYILSYSKNHLIQRFCCKWFLKKNNNNEYIIICKFNPWWFGIFILPYAILQFFYLLWDGGLKNFPGFSFELSRLVCVGAPSDSVDKRFGRIVKIWEQ